jgi:hypothetical protein
MATSALTTTAWVVHDLGLATNFGGSLFGKTSLHPAVRKLDSKQERGELVSTAWQQFSPLNAVALGAAALTWIVGRSAISGRSIDRGARRMVLAKDVLIAASVATGVGSMVSGYLLSQSDQGKPPPIEAGGQPSRSTPERSRVLQQASDWFGYGNLVAGGALVGITAALAMKSGRSTKWAAIARLLP